MAPRFFLVFIFQIVLATSLALPALAGLPNSCNTSAATQTATGTFYPYRFGTQGIDRHYRDLELLWDSAYSTLTDSVRSTLNRLAASIVDSTANNTFHAPLGNLQIAYDYFRREGSFYSLNPLDVTSLVAGNTHGDGAVASYNAIDRSHIDYYIVAPPPTRPDSVTVDMYPSRHTTNDEDVSTGHTSGDVKHANSVSVNGPPVRAQYDLTGSRWTHPDSGTVSLFLHEFEHSLPPSPGVGFLDELFATGSQTIAGWPDSSGGPGSGSGEIPYTWSLASFDPLLTQSPSCQSLNPLIGKHNYAAWAMLTAYLAYNFRGRDTSATSIGLTDDLFRKWARSSLRDLPGLASLLSDDSCGTCSTLVQFHPGGPPLSNHDRMQLLLHNWRVANYVNNSTLLQGQYGYAPQFRFSPSTTFAAWQTFDGCGRDDILAIPPTITLSTRRLTTDTTLVGDRSFRGSTFPFALSPLSAQYLVIRSDAALSSGTQNLLVRVTPEGFCRCDLAEAVSIYTGRLVISVVGYTQQDTATQESKLWAHPEWAQVIVGPTWVDVDSAAGPVELSIPGFGTTYKAALLVLSLGAGPNMQYPGFLPTSFYKCLPFRINLALTKPPFLTPNPLPVAETVGSPDDFPAWSPNSDELVYSHVTTGSRRFLLRRKLDGSPAVPLFDPGPPHNQVHSDWAPRGDWIVFDQDAGPPTPCNIWARNILTNTSRQLTTSDTTSCLWPAFSPNGQEVAFFQYTTQGPIQIRRIAFDGTMNVLVAQFINGTFTSPRWSPDGQWIYFARNDSLYAVSANSGPPISRFATLGFLSRTFDFHLGSGPILVEKLGLQGGNPLGGCPTPLFVHPIVLRDTLLLDTQVRALRRRYEFGNPRYSLDGTKIAYEARPNGVFDPDIFAAQVIYDHAPSFNGLTDIVTDPGVPVAINLSATDPDGEVVTYQDVPRYRPPGATFNSQGQFRWNDPQPPGAQHFVVFRALDPSGGVANRVVKINVVEGSCPFLDTRTASGWETENSLLNRSLSNSMTLDAYRLKLSPQVLNGRYRLRLRENEQEFTSLDQVRLMSVDHAPGVRAWYLGDRVVLGTRLPPYRVMTKTAADITNFVDGSGSGYFIGQPGETLLVELVNPDSGTAHVSEQPPSGDLDPFEIDDGGKNPGGSGLVATQPEGQVPSLDAAILRSTGILIQGRDAGGVWRTFRQRYPREHFDDFIVDTLDQGPIRLVFVGRHKLRYVGRVVPTSAVTPEEVPLLAATHSRVGDVRLALLGTDGVTAALTPGDTIALDFSASSVPPGKVRDFFLLSKGVYSSVQPESHESVTATLPIRFALLQNQPNPFAKTTNIHFELPRTEHVRLDVFDLQGRLVRHLGDARYEPGRWNVEWDRREASGGRAPAGIYLYRLIAGSFRQERKMVLLP